MPDQKSKTNAKRLPKGQRTHNRRVKQEARKEVPLSATQPSPAQPVRPPKKAE